MSIVTVEEANAKIEEAVQECNRRLEAMRIKCNHVIALAMAFSFVMASVFAAAITYLLQRFVVI